MIQTDQFRFDAFSPDVTPNLYKLSQKSTFFENFYASTPTCTPARAAILTGKSPWYHGMLGYGLVTNCEKYATTFPEILTKDLGYHSFSVGKNHFGQNKRGKFVTQGYSTLAMYDGLFLYEDDYDLEFNETHPNVSPLSTCDLQWNDWKPCPYEFEEDAHPTAWTTRKALDALEGYNWNSNHSKPLLAKVSYHRPHSPYDPPKRLWYKHMNKPPVDRILNINATSWEAKYKNTPESMPRDAWRGDPGMTEARRIRHAYLANVEFVDEGVGQILGLLEKKQVLDQTLILWVTDHSDQGGDHFLWRKGYPWQSSVHVPMLIKLPGQRVGRKSTGLAEHRDIAVTLYDYLGIWSQIQAQDATINGKSLVPVCKGVVRRVRTWLDLEHSKVFNSDIHWNAILAEMDNGSLWKYILFQNGREQLFNLDADPNEFMDRSKESVKELDLMRFLMKSQFYDEQRGSQWIQGNGTIALGRKPIVFAENYPCGDHDEEKATTLPA